MPNTRSLNPLDDLRHRLLQELEIGKSTQSVEWGNPRVMKETLKSIRHELGGEGYDRPSEDKLRAVLVRFARDGQVLSFTDLKYLCYGATVPFGRDQSRLIDRHSLFDNLLDRVHERAGQAKHFRRCYQGLLSGYFGFQRNLEEPGEAEQRWVHLRDFLAKQLTIIRQVCLDKGHTPSWITILCEHQNLLTADPCSRYAKALEQDDESELNAVCAGLAIPSNSWVWVEATMAYVKQVCQAGDDAFKQKLPVVLDLVNGAKAVTLPPALAVIATAMLVRRYRNCADHPEHDRLRDTCVQWIGNPWVKRVAWDAAVNHEPTRLMVNTWLKQRLIRDFFELLAADGAADLRRLNYWLKWEPNITDMWFVLGGEAISNKSPEFTELRKRMSGRDRRLYDPNQLNNAFVMRIGPLLVIEFGLTGNACYIFAASDFNTNLDKRLLNTDELKQKVGVAARLSHSGLNWEGKFDLEIKKLLQRIPESKGVLLSTPAQDLASTSKAQPLQQPEQNPHQQSRSSPVASVVAQSPLRPPIEVVPPEPMSAEKAKSQIKQPARVWPFPRMDRSGSEDGSSSKQISGRPNAVSIDRNISTPVSSQAAQTKPSLDKGHLPPRQRLGEMELAQLQKQLSDLGIECEDNRTRGGALWVLITDERKHPRVVASLKSYGFRFTAGRGFWLKG